MISVSSCAVCARLPGALGRLRRCLRDGFLAAAWMVFAWPSSPFRIGTNYTLRRACRRRLQPSRGRIGPSTPTARMGNTRDRIDDSPASHRSTAIGRSIPARDEEQRRARCSIAAAERLAATAARATRRTSFVAALFGRAAPEDLVRYDAARARGAGRGGLGASCRAQAGRAEDPLAKPPRPPGGERLKPISVIEIVNDDMPFLVDSVMARTDRARARRRAWSCIRSSRSSATRPASSTGVPRRGRRRARRAARKLHPHPCRAHRRRGAPRPRSSQALEQVLAEVRRLRAGLAADAGARRRGDRGAQDQSAAAAGRRDRRGDPVPGMAGRRQFHLPRRARLRLHRRRGRARAAISRPGSACCATATCRCCARGDQLVVDHAGDPRLPRRAEAADRHQGQRRARACTAASTRLHRRQALRRRRQARRANSASSACSPRPPIRARRARSRICAARSTPCCAAPASIRTAIPARRWSTCWRPIRATSCSRSTRTRSIEFALAILQLDERPRVRVLARRDRFDRFVSVLVYRAARPLRQRRARARSATISPRSTRAASAPSIRSSRKAPLVRVHFIIGRDGGATPESRPRDAGRRGRRDRAHLDRRLARGACARRTSRHARARCWRATATRSPTAIARPIRRGVAVDDIRVIETLSRGAAARRRLLSPRRGRRRHSVGLKVWSYRAADPAVGARAGAGEHGLPRRRRADLSRSRRRRRTSPTSGSTT